MRGRIRVQTITVKMGPKLESPYTDNAKIEAQKMTANALVIGPRHTRHGPNKPGAKGTVSGSKRGVEIGLTAEKLIV